jgi:putative FmdB family regulatory protein
MPIYEYRCTACGCDFDQLFPSVHQVPAEITCPACQSTTVRRRFSAPARIGRSGPSVDEAAASEPAKPPVFGRKELNEVLKNK